MHGPRVVVEEMLQAICENGGAKVCHGSGGMIPRRAA